MSCRALVWGLSLCLLASLGLAVAAFAEGELAPPVDAQGRFWIYGEIPDATGNFVARPETAVPSGWMPAEVLDILDEAQTSIKCAEQPHTGNVCWRVVVKRWAPPYWCGIAWFTKDGGNDRIFEPDATWPAYDLSRAKKLVFWARGAEGDEVLQVKIGILTDKTLGDRTTFPIASKWLRLTSQWTRYELLLTDYADRLTHIVIRFPHIDN